MVSSNGDSQGFVISQYVIDKEPFYVDVNGETELFKAAYEEKIPVMLKGPTGCGKSRFIEYMSYQLNQHHETVSRKGRKGISSRPLVTVPCHEDLSADDLKGRHLIDGTYQDGAALTAVRQGGILYLDEIVEARNDTTVVIHPLADHRRALTIEKLGKVFEAPDTFMLAISYNPGYQKKTKDLKQSTKQRFMAINFTYAPPELEQRIVEHESGVNKDIAASLVEIGGYIRNLKGKELDEGASTRLLIHAGKLIRRGIEPYRACRVALLNPITDDVDVYAEINKGLEEIVGLKFPKGS
jgi:nitric oxide reductase NorQ protein